MTELNQFEFNQVMTQLTRYGQKGFEEINFTDRNGKLVPALTKQANWLSRVVRWVLGKGYKEVSVAQKIVKFLEENRVNLPGKEREISLLKNIFSKRIKPRSDQNLIERQFENLMSRIHGVTRENRSFEGLLTPQGMKDLLLN